MYETGPCRLPHNHHRSPRSSSGASGEGQYEASLHRMITETAGPKGIGPCNQ